MANPCSTKYVFYGDKKAIKEFSQRIKKHTNESGFCVLREIVQEFNIPHDTPHRGEITCFYSDDTTVTIYTETAWSPTLSLWDRIIVENFYDLENNCRKINYVYLAEECGCGLFINSDTTGEYLPEKYLIDTAFDDENGKWKELYEYYNSESELVKGWNAEFNTSFETAEEVIKEAERLNENTDGFVGVREFKPVII